ncbi:two-component sensor histidine kinase [Pigmentiphaga sp. NML080357]|uniref:sensor histidine kinase n=1 Tax=Pigmentiphaga sp. NML080357 TaxID=2008675 RepID=UPI000B40F40A|nr:HAMP domain-containing sensor histidine kinase [Pigmentiphaga sp. NML080357]OVZ55102.1 two-component sensor histidine kinase [Pigmentiphaga sp. NML080357]
MKRLTLTQRLSAVFAVLLLACSGISLLVQIHASARHEQEVVQQLSNGLASHIAATAQLMDASGWRPDAVHDLFDKLMAVNPSVEVYLLDTGGRIVGHAAPPGRLKRDRVDLEPVRRLVAGGRLPILGDDPRSADIRKVFSAAPVHVGGKEAGFVYVILQGEAHDAVAAGLARHSAWRMTAWIVGLVALLGLVMGLIAFRLITRPLRALAGAVRNFDGTGEVPATLMTASAADDRGDEIATLRAAFVQMGRRIAEQWRELTRQDQQRRDLIANISHDLRTPLTSLHGYLETLRIKDDLLSPAERHRYLDIALDQSRKVGALAQELFELARLESGLVQPEREAFALPDLVQDVVQKFELAAEARRQQLLIEMPPALPLVHADLAMIDRVLTNLLDNAIRHNPPGTRITVRLAGAPDGLRVDVHDTGTGIPEALRPRLFKRIPALGRTAQAGGGLGLIIVQRILKLHGSEIRLVDEGEPGTVFRFCLAAASSSAVSA